MAVKLFRWAREAGLAGSGGGLNADEIAARRAETL